MISSICKLKLSSSLGPPASCTPGTWRGGRFLSTFWFTWRQRVLPAGLRRTREFFRPQSRRRRRGSAPGRRRSRSHERRAARAAVSSHLQNCSRSDLKTHSQVAHRSGRKSHRSPARSSIGRGRLSSRHIPQRRLANHTDRDISPRAIAPRRRRRLRCLCLGEGGSGPSPTPVRKMEPLVARGEGRQHRAWRVGETTTECHERWQALQVELKLDLSGRSKWN